MQIIKIKTNTTYNKSNLKSPRQATEANEEQISEYQFKVRIERMKDESLMVFSSTGIGNNCGVDRTNHLLVVNLTPMTPYVC